MEGNKMNEPRKPKAGDLIQIWDRHAIRTGDNAKIADHGKCGYIMRESKRTDTFLDGKGDTKHLSHIVAGDVFKIILFENGGSNVIHVHQDNIRRVHA
jgi:hypothetical protein|tara:strand:- start:67 stop:360 length:294 start_codon:yes stop_codon:yes gene_type:complete